MKVYVKRNRILTKPELKKLSSALSIVEKKEFARIAGISYPTVFRAVEGLELQFGVANKILRASEIVLLESIKK